MNDYIAPIETVSRTLKKLIERDVLLDFPDDEPAPEKNVGVSFDVPDKQFASTLPDEPLINVYLFSFQENLERRYAESFAVMNESVTDPIKSLARAPRLVDLNYMISAWTRSETEKALMEQHLLSRVIQGLGKYSMLPVELMAELDYDPGPGGVAMRMLLDQDSKRSQGEFWSSLGVYPKPLLNMQLTVPIDVHAALEVPAIRSLNTRMDAIAPPEDPWSLVREALAISGQIILDEANTSTSFQSVVVYLRSFSTGERWQASVDFDGRYGFSDLLPGEYLIWAVDEASDKSSPKDDVVLVRDHLGNPVQVVKELSIPA